MRGTHGSVSFSFVLLLQELVAEPLLTLHFVNVFAPQGQLGNLEEEMEERTHPYP